MRRRATFRGAIMAAVVLAAVGWAFLHWKAAQGFIETSNAYVGANVISISAQVGGQIAHLHVRNNEAVKAGQLLLEMDPEPFRIARAKAAADLAMARLSVAQAAAAVNAALAVAAQREAELHNAQAQLDRNKQLLNANFISAQRLDNSLTAVEAARATLALALANAEQARSSLGKTGANNARVQAAEAMFAQAELDLERTHILAPEAGRVGNLTLQAGQNVQARAPLFALIADGDYWVDANFKENELDHIQPGRPATVLLDSYPDHPFHGVVDSLSAGSGTAFSLLPPQNATGNWVKVTQRVPVRVRIVDPDAERPLRVGTSATVKIDLRASTAFIRGVSATSAAQSEPL